MGFHLVIHVHLVLVFDELTLAVRGSILLVQTFGHIWGHTDKVLIGLGLLHLLGSLSDVLGRTVTFTWADLLLSRLLPLIIRASVRRLQTDRDRELTTRKLPRLNLQLIDSLLFQLLFLEVLMGCLLHLVLFVAPVRQYLAQLTEARSVNFVELQHHPYDVAELSAVRQSLL